VLCDKAAKRTASDLSLIYAYLSLLPTLKGWGVIREEQGLRNAREEILSYELGSLLLLEISFWLRELPAFVSLMMASEGEWRKIQSVLDRVLKSDENFLW